MTNEIKIATNINDRQPTLRREFDPKTQEQTLVIEGDSLNVSDGYHTIDELYSHRIELYIALCRAIIKIHGIVYDPVRPVDGPLVWRSKLHSDGSSFEGWFVLGVGTEPGKQITYHLPDLCWEDTNFAKTLDRAPEWDGHSAADVLERLSKIFEEYTFRTAPLTASQP